MVTTLRELLERVIAASLGWAGGLCAGRVGSESGYVTSCQQSFQSTHHLMNKPLNYGGAVVAKAKQFALVIGCLTCVGLGSVSAQKADIQAGASTLTATRSTVKTPVSNPTANANWRTSLESSIALKAEIGRLAVSGQQTAATETQVSITRDYYLLVLERIGTTGDVAGAYANSFIDLARVGDRFPAANRPDYNVVRRNLLTLITR